MPQQPVAPSRGGQEEAVSGQDEVGEVVRCHTCVLVCVYVCACARPCVCPCACACVCVCVCVLATKVRSCRSWTQVDLVQGLMDRAVRQGEKLVQEGRRRQLELESRTALQLVELKARWTRVARPCSECGKMCCERPKGSVRDTQGGDIFISRNQWGKKNRRCEKCLENVP